MPQRWRKERTQNAEEPMSYKTFRNLAQNSTGRGKAPVERARTAARLNPHRTASPQPNPSRRIAPCRNSPSPPRSRPRFVAAFPVATAPLPPSYGVPRWWRSSRWPGPSTPPPRVEPQTPAPWTPTPSPSSPAAKTSPPFRQSERWGGASFNEVAAAEAGAAAGSDDPNRDNVGLVGLVASPTSRVALLVEGEGTVTRRTPGDALPDGRVLTEVAANTATFAANAASDAPTEEPSPTEDVLILFPPVNPAPVEATAPPDSTAQFPTPNPNR